MGKKRKTEDNNEIIRWKIRRLEEKLKKPNRRPIIYSSDEESQDSSSDSTDSRLARAPVGPSPSSSRSPNPPTPRPVTPPPQPRPEPQQPPETQQRRVSPPAPPHLSSPPRVTSPILDPLRAVPPDDTAEKELDDDILCILGDAPKPETNFGKNIHKDIAARWQETLKKGLSKEIKEKLLKEYLLPANCDFLLPPILNPEAKAALPEAMLKRDLSLQNKQKQIGIALAALSQATELIIAKEISVQKILKPISDASRLLCDSHFCETQTRRGFVISAINTSLKDALVDSARDKYLFGENVAEKLKTAENIQKSGQELKNQPKNPFHKNNFIINNSRNRTNFKTLHPKTAGKPDAGRARPAPRTSTSRAPPARRQPPSAGADRPPPPSQYHSRRPQRR